MGTAAGGDAILPSLLPALFPKKPRDSLAMREALKEVRAIYYAGADDPTTFRIGHLTAHRLPQSLDPRARRLRVAAFFALALAWWLLYPRGEKVRSAIAACAYSGVEFTYEFLKRGRAYTSAEQFLGNLVYTPLLLSARLENLGMMRQLIEHHANLNATDKAGDTALAWAARQNQAEAIEVQGSVPGARPQRPGVRGGRRLRTRRAAPPSA